MLNRNSNSNAESEIGLLAILENKANNKAVFEKNCLYAIDKNEKELDALLKLGVCVGIFQGEYSPVMFLADNKKHEAVFF